MGMGGAPAGDEFEITLFGPGYGESILLHIGDGAWAVVDSCLGEGQAPIALRYLEGIGIDPANAVRLIVATHLHDDHIRGVSRLVETCRHARFCCASALTRTEFLAAIAALEGRHLSVAGSGVREIHRVFSQLSQRPSIATPVFAIANRRLLQRGRCEVWALSPDDASLVHFLQSVGDLLPGEGDLKRHVPDPSPNNISVTLWIQAGGFAVLLGADLERRGWITILQNTGRPPGVASVFKVPHHGSATADEPTVWNQMLERSPVAILAPWRRGRRELPGRRDAQRILLPHVEG